MPNEFYVQPANPLGGLQDVIGGYLEGESEKQQKEKQQGELVQNLQRASDLMVSNDAAGLTDFMIKNPGLRDHIITTQKHVSKQSQAGKVQALKDIIVGKPVNEVMQKQISLIKSEGGDPTEAEAFLDPSMTDEQRKQRALSGLALYDPQAAKAYLANQPQKTEFKQGTGDMSGYAFDPSTGTFSMDPVVKRQLAADAQELATKEQLSAKDVSGVNDKVTALTKDVRGIRDAAASLDVLKGSSSPASQIAAVFKFMKALDPTSTVRESELGLVYSAEGAAQGLANKINKLMGEGQLSGPGFEDIVNTSKKLANSAITSTQDGVGSYLNVIQDNLSPKQFGNLNARVPEPFEIEQAAPAELPPVNAKGWKLMTDANGNSAYVGPNDEIEEVKDGI